MFFWKNKGGKMMHTIVKHPLIDVKLSIMRDESTKSKEFRENLNEIASFMCFEVFKDLETYDANETYKTPTGVELHRKKLKQKYKEQIKKAGNIF